MGRHRWGFGHWDQTRLLHVRLPVDLIDALEAELDGSSISRARAIASAIEDWLEARGSDAPKMEPRARLRPEPEDDEPMPAPPPEPEPAPVDPDWVLVRPDL